MLNRAEISRSFSTFGGWVGKITPAEGASSERKHHILEDTLREAKAYTERIAGQPLTWRREKTWLSGVPKSQQEPGITYIAEW